MHLKLPISNRHGQSSLDKQINNLDFYRPLHGPTRRSSRKFVVEESASDSGELNEAGGARQKITSLPAEPYLISTSSNSSNSGSPHAQKPADTGSDSSRKRRKNTSSKLLHSSLSSVVASDGSVSDSSVTRTTRSKSKVTSGSCSNTSSPTSSSNWHSAAQSLNTSGEESTPSRVMRTRHSKKSDISQTTSKLETLSIKAQETSSSRRSSRNRKSK